MKKVIPYLIILLVVLFSLIACSNQSSVNMPQDNNSTSTNTQANNSKQPVSDNSSVSPNSGGSDLTKEVNQVLSREIFIFKDDFSVLYTATINLEQTIAYAANWTFDKILNSNTFQNIKWSVSEGDNNSKIVAFNAEYKGTTILVQFGILQDAEPYALSMYTYNSKDGASEMSMNSFVEQGQDYDAALVCADAAISSLLVVLSDDAISPATQYYESQADTYMNSGNYDSAIEYYKKANISGTKLSAAYYAKAENYLASGNLDSAGLYFGYAGNYKDSAVRVLEVHYKRAQQYEQHKDYLSAITSYAKAGDYSDAKTKHKECSYQQGKLYLNNKQYLEAAEFFASAGDYLDSSTKTKECYYEYGKMQLTLGYTTSGITYLEKCRGFKDTDEYVLSYYFKQAQTLFNAYLNEPKSFDWENEPTYESVRSALERCEGYGTSAKMLSVLNAVHGLWLSAEKAFDMLIRNKPAYAGYTCHMEGFTVTYTDNTITLYEKALQNAYNNSNEATIVTDQNKSYFHATVKNIFERFPWGGDAKDIIRSIVAMFTGNYNDIDLENHLNGESWVKTDAGYKTEILYGGYNIVITSSHENYGYTDLVITTLASQSPTHSHQFGNWVKQDSTSHTRVCSCGASESVAHSFDSGRVTKEPTATSTGIKTYTCNACGATNSVTIPTNGTPDVPEQTTPETPDVSGKPENEKREYSYNCICNYCQHNDGVKHLQLENGVKTDVIWNCSSCGRENWNYVTLNW